MTVAIRPLSVDEFVEPLAFDCDGEKPRRKDSEIEDWRWEDHEKAVLSMCSSLITFVVANGSRVVQFSHVSVKELLMLYRLATSTHDKSQYHIVL